MTTTLVSGAANWIGKRLAQVLVEGLPSVPAVAPPLGNGRVRCLLPPGTAVQGLADLPGVEFVRGAPDDSAAAAEFCRDAGDATLIHIPSPPGPGPRLRRQLVERVEGTRRVLLAAERAGVRRAVVVSSPAPAGVTHRPDEVFDETWPYRPFMSSGRAAMLTECIVHAVWLRRRMETVLIRLPWCYGPGQPARQTALLSAIRRGVAPITGSGGNRRSMSYIDNVCQGLVLAARAPAAAGKTYWLSDRRPYSLNEIMLTVERLMEMEFALPVRRRWLRLPGVLVSGATWADGIMQAAGIYQPALHGLAELDKTVACSVLKAQHELGYDPHIDLTEGMRRTLAWCRDERIAV